MKHWETTLAVLAALSASIALAEDFKTVTGKEYKNAKVSRVEPDGIVLKTRSGISKVYFTELPKEVQLRFGYDLAKIEAEAAAARAAAEKRIAEEKAAEQERAKTEKNAQADLTPPLFGQSQLDAPQFEDLRRRDWYEDLKKQSQLKNKAEFKLAWIAMRQKEPCTNSAELCAILKSEMDAHRTYYETLSAVASEIQQTKTYEAYAKLKEQEQTIISQIATQIVSDGNDAMHLEVHISEKDAALLRLAQQYFTLDLRWKIRRSLGYVSAIDSNARTIWIVDAHGYGKPFIVRSDEILTAFVELEPAIRAI